MCGEIICTVMYTTVTPKFRRTICVTLLLPLSGSSLVMCDIWSLDHHHSGSQIEKKQCYLKGVCFYEWAANLSLRFGSTLYTGAAS